MSSDEFPTPRSADVPVAFPAKAVRPFPDPRPAGSAVSAVSAVGASGMADSERGTLMATLRMEVLERSAERTVVRVETAASVAAREAAPDGAAPVGTELQVSHLHLARRGWVTAVATPVHRGRRTAVYEVRISDEDGRPVARGVLRSLYTDTEEI